MQLQIVIRTDMEACASIYSCKVLCCHLILHNCISYVCTSIHTRTFVRAHYGHSQANHVEHLLISYTHPLWLALWLTRILVGLTPVRQAVHLSSRKGLRPQESHKVSGKSFDSSCLSPFLCAAEAARRCSHCLLQASDWWYSGAGSLEILQNKDCRPQAVERFFCANRESVLVKAFYVL